MYALHVLYLSCRTKNIIMLKRLRATSCICIKAKGCSFEASFQKYDKVETNTTNYDIVDRSSRSRSTKYNSGYSSLS